MSDADAPARHGEALLAAYRDHTGPSPEATERLLAALRRDAARADLTHDPSTVLQDMPRSTGTSRHAPEDSPERSATIHVLRPHPARRWVLAAGLLAAAVIAALALRPQSGQRQIRDDDDNAAAFAPGAATITTTARERPAPPRSTQPTAPLAPEAGTSAPPTSDSSPRTPPRARREPAGSLADEMQRMRPAQLALAAGDPRAALELLDAYARDYPDGRLHEEHLALHAIARCQQGAPEGASEAEAFLRAHPLSMFAERVRSACENQ